MEKIGVRWEHKNRFVWEFVVWFCDSSQRECFLDLMEYRGICGSFWQYQLSKYWEKGVPTFCHRRWWSQSQSLDNWQTYCFNGISLFFCFFFVLALSIRIWILCNCFYFLRVCIWCVVWSCHFGNQVHCTLIQRFNKWLVVKLISIML